MLTYKPAGKNTRLLLESTEIWEDYLLYNLSQHKLIHSSKPFLRYPYLSLTFPIAVYKLRLSLHFSDETIASQIRCFL